MYVVILLPSLFIITDVCFREDLLCGHELHGTYDIARTIRFGSSIFICVDDNPEARAEPYITQ
jgi:hypothetical protein